MLEGNNRNYSLRECLIELNLQFDIYSISICLFTRIYLSLQICTGFQNDSIKFVRLEELKVPTVIRVEGEEGIEW